MDNPKLNPKLHVAEYKRVCNECNKVWHSLVERETKLSPHACCCSQDSRESPFLAGVTDQTRRNMQAKKDTLEELRKCPICGSNNYTETIIYYEKK